MVKDEIDFNFVAIQPPSEGELRKRLIKRGTKEEEIERRMEHSIRERQLIDEANYIQFRLVNDDEEGAFKKLEEHLRRLYPFLEWVFMNDWLILILIFIDFYFCKYVNNINKAGNDFFTPKKKKKSN